MTRSVLIIIFCLFQCIASGQQDTIFRQVKTLTGDFVGVAVDNLDNIYTVDSRNRLKKFNSNGDSVAVYNDVKQFGNATLIDVSNPLKILLYYRDFATIVELDRVLNPVNVIDLRRLNIFQARTIGQAYDNSVWVYDEQENKLKKVNGQGKVTLETPDFRLMLGKAITPVRIFDENRYVYVYDPLHGAYVFDYFGTLRNNILLQNWENFSVTGKYIFGSRGDTVFRYEIKTFRLDEWKMPEAISGSQAFRFSSSRLYALRANADGSASLYIYSIL
jgi:hypothetical protein